MTRQRLNSRARGAYAALAAFLCAALVMAMGAAPAVGSSSEAEQGSGASESAWIHPDLIAETTELAATQRSGGSREHVQAILVLDGGADLSEVTGDARAVAAELREHAAATQQPALRSLDGLAAQSSSHYRVLNELWILNAIVVEVTPELGALEQLATLPGVRRVVPNFEMTVPERDEDEGRQVAETDLAAATVEDRTWGIDRIRAHELWEEFDLTGEGIRVAVLDTGVDISHPDLAGRMHTDDAGDPSYPGGWMQFDDVGNLIDSEPWDSGTHGTHVSGTVLGGNASGTHIGVAPGATLMAGLVLPGGSGEFAQVAAGMQWAIDPVDAGGQPAGEPADVLNLSLGAPGYYPEMIEPTQNVRAAGVFPAFSSGNLDFTGNCAGPGTGNDGSGSPANVYEAFAVGASDPADDIAGFSCGELLDTAASWGVNAPGHWPASYTVPDVSAPGVDVLSAVTGGGHMPDSGTSMAAPHVAGAAALLLEAHDLDVDSLAEAFEGGAVWDDRYSATRPDRRYGHGVIDVYEAYHFITLETGLEGTIADLDGEPIAGAQVTLNGDLALVTDAAGGYRRPLAPGDYTVEVAAFGFDTYAGTHTVADNAAFTTLDVELATSPTGWVVGEVTSESTGEPIAGASVELLGTPLGEVTDEIGLFFVMGIPAGDYEIEIDAGGYRSSGPMAVTIPENDGVILDVALADSELVGLLGNPDGKISALLAEHDYESEAFDVGADLADYAVIVANNRFPSPGEGAYVQFLQQARDAGVGIVFLDTWSNTINAVPMLSEYTGNPATVGRDDDFDQGRDLGYEVLAEHPVVAGFAPGETIDFDTTTLFRDHAWFEGWTDDEWGQTQVLADATLGGERLGGGIGVRENAETGLRQVLLSMHGISGYTSPEDWAPESVEVFFNALEWTGDAGSGEPGPPLPGEGLVGIAGDSAWWSEETHFAELLDELGVAHAPFEVGDDPADFEAIIWNAHNWVEESPFLAFLDEAREAGTGVMFLDTMAGEVMGPWLLHFHTGNPAVVEPGTLSAGAELAYEVEAEHPILEGFAPGESVILEEESAWGDFAWFDGWVSDEYGEASVLASVSVDGTVIGSGIGVREAPGVQHALLSMHGASGFAGPQYWHQDARQVFVNTLEWMGVEVDDGAEPPAPEPAIEVTPGALDGQAEEGESTVLDLQIASTGEALLEWQIDVAGTASALAGEGAPLPQTAETDGGGADHEWARPRSGGETIELAPLQAAEAGLVTLTHSAEPGTIVDGNSTVCADPFTGFTADNRFLRIFDLGDFGLAEGLEVTEVEFGIESLTTEVTAEINLYVLEDDLFVYANLLEIGSASVELGPGSLELVQVPVTGAVPAGERLVVEIDVPDLTGQGGFVPGSNGAGESAPTYLSSVACGFPEPAPVSQVAPSMSMHLVMSVTGTGELAEPGACEVPGGAGWLSVDPPAGQLEPGANAAVSVTMDAAGLAPGVHEAVLCVLSNAAGASVVEVPVSFEVTEADGGPVPPDPELIETDLQAELLETEVTTGGEIVIHGALSPGQGREVTLVEIHGTQPTGALDAARESGGMSPQELRIDAGIALFTFRLPAGSEPGERVFRVYTPETEVATEALSEALAVVVTEPAQSPFVDVPLDHQFYEAIVWLAQQGISTGWPDGTFRPSEPISRHAMATFLYRYAGEPEVVVPGQSPFVDVPVDHQSYEAIVWLAQQGISTGWPDGTFRPSEPISRHAMATFLYRYAGEPEVVVPGQSPFVDVPVDHQSYEAIVWLAQQGISTGWPDGTFQPSAPILRSAMAAFLYRYDHIED